MPGVEGGILYRAEQLRPFTIKVLEKVGVSPADAEIVTDSLIEANLRGVDTHGITRMLCTYVARIQKGLMDPKAEIAVVRDRPSTALVDARNAIGQVAAQRCMELAIKKAKQTGTAFVGVTHSNHYGAAAYWAMMALDHGMIGFSSTNAPAAVAPWGGCTPMLGTNPFAIAVPAGKMRPVVLDIATTVVARGRIVLFAKQGLPLEPGWAFDDRGRPTVDAQAAMKGLLAPIGGHKGYGIALAIDLLCGVLTGANYGAHFPGFLAEDFTRPTDVGSVFAVIDVDAFMDLAEFQTKMDVALGEIVNSEKAEGVSRIYIPGEIEFETKAERLANGIPVPEAVVKDLMALGEELGVPFPRA